MNYSENLTPSWKSVMVTRHLPEQLAGLEMLCRNLWWCWNDDAKALFKSIDAELWHKSGHNPMEILDKVSLKRYNELAKDEDFLARMNRVINEFYTYMEKKNERTEPSVAYFCMEYGLDTSLKIYSGGLGILAGDYLKETSDMNVNLVAIGLLYRYGYFTQRLHRTGLSQDSCRAGYRRRRRLEERKHEPSWPHALCPHLESGSGPHGPLPSGY